MEKKVLDFIEEKKMIQHGDSVVLGVSGGADSMCLLSILDKISKEMDLTIIAVHVNHHVRGKEADEDQRYVEEFCKNLGVKCVVRHIDMKKLAESLKCSEEEAGRIARYEIFESVLLEEKADKIAVAHNLNDNSETILFNLFRGTGVKGLSGIMSVRDRIIRPILCLTRAEIEKYLAMNEIEYRVDSTNTGDDYARNRIRHHVIPYVEDNINSNAVGNIVNAGNDLAEIEEYLKIETERQKEKHTYVTENSCLIKESLLQCHVVIQKRIIRSMIGELSGKLKDVTRYHVQSALDLFDKNVGKELNLPYHIMAKREYEGVRFMLPTNNGNSMRNDITNEVIYKESRVFPNEYVTVEMENGEIFTENVPELVYTKWIDCDIIKSGLVVRTRQTGDFLTIDDQGNTKKLKDYFINEKVPKEQRDSVLLVADGSHVVWVIGHRISSDYRINEKTKNVLRLTYNDKQQDKNQ